MGKGRKPIPEAVRALRGYPDKRPPRECVSPPSAVPRKPSHLKGEAAREWRRISRELGALGILTEVDRAALAAYCDAYAQWVQADRELAALAGDSGRSVLLVTDAKGNTAPNPLLKIRQDALDLMRRFLVEFGLTPSSRAKIKAPPKKPESALSRFLVLPARENSA